MLHVDLSFGETIAQSPSPSGWGAIHQLLGLQNLLEDLVPIVE